MTYLIRQLLFLTVALVCVAGDEDFETRLYRAQQHLYDAKYEIAARELMILSKEYSYQPGGPFFHAMAYLWQLGFRPDDTQLITNAITLLKNAHNRANHSLNSNAKNPEMLFWRGISTGVITVCEVLLETSPEQRNPNIFSSILGRFRALDKFRLMQNDLQLSLNYNPELIDSHLGLALYGLYSGRNKQKGIEQLWSVIDKGKYLKTEASYLLVDFLYGQGSHDDLLYRAIPINLGLSMQYSDNLLFQLALAKLYYEIENFDGAESVLVQLLNDSSRPYHNLISNEAHYFLGTIAFNKEKYSMAIEHFEHIFASNPRLPDYLIPWTYFRSAQCHWRLGNIPIARKLLEKTLGADNVNGVHFEANNLLKELAKK